MRKMPPLILILLSAISLYSCKKTTDCPGKTTVSVNANQTSITEGWDLKLSTDYLSLYRYVWSGPNGWSVQTTGAVVTRPNMQPQDAGTYSVKVYNDKNCEIQEGASAITVAAVQDAPCQGSLANNTCTTDITILPNMSFNTVLFSNNANALSSNVTCYITPIVSGNPIMYFTFAGHNRPKAGKYKTIYGYFALGKEDEVSINLYEKNTGNGKSFFSSAGYEVYVTTVNGKTQICFCNVQVRDAPSGNLNYISGKVTISN